MSRSTARLPQSQDDLFLADGGLETTLVFVDGFDLPDFAAFPLLADPAGRRALDAYYDAYARIGVRDRVGVVLDTPTWRANPDWAARLGYGADALDAANRDAVDLLAGVRTRHRTAATPVVISGAVGPRGDGYQVGEVMSAAEARAYHAVQLRSFAASPVDLATAVTMTYWQEAAGLALAARDVGVPVVVSFTVETDGALPSGQPLGDAIGSVDAATAGYPAYYMVNCAHPSHFRHVLAGDWTRRIGGVRANASTLSHAELDQAATLDHGDPTDLAERYDDLRTLLPGLRVFGGCCGTDHRHIDAISRRLVRGDSESAHSRLSSFA
jgi:S-methylmethionine-dependent homocysteine/selenocysteine methylase